MTVIRLGYVAMIVQLKNSSPSQTMTYKHYSTFPDKEAAKRKLERIASSNLQNCLRLLRHNAAHDIHFFRLSSRLIPLATHEDLAGWDYLQPLQEDFAAIGEFAKKHEMRLDFHPDHFVLLNSPRSEVVKASLHTLKLHYDMLRAMKIDPVHRCVMHVGGVYNNKEKALETFIENWGVIPKNIQHMIMLENDDKSFTLHDTLYLCEKLNIPLAFDIHHHLAHHEKAAWEEDWERVLGTWKDSPLPVKMHISSPKSESQYRAHADYIDPGMFMDFLKKVKGSTEQIDCMIEAKKKDEALFKLVTDLHHYADIEWIDQATFRIT
ncbi:UV DNA damage repair endonuclease UvsE [Alteribacillus iranensis]|uniref:UV-damage endonuclease n=1 Tax=Alteribacillus iranensis TaxID=930128 RepID=A0A1I2B7F8_9BACI|nr:UV DNA damage repair endonuclease UvsE [Alteribacillus iranensis]SFE51080.1 UV-damage endonuclease [Alteribacillus iranensis]